MKVEINLKIILLGILFFVLEQLDMYLIFLIFIVFHEIAHIVFGHIEKTDGISKEDEKCADEYAECMMKTIYALNDENGARA